LKQAGNLHNIWFTHDAHIFYLNGIVNIQIRLIWGTENPNFHLAALLQSTKCTIWCALSSVCTVDKMLLRENVNYIPYGAFLEETHILYFYKGVDIRLSLTT
jgi:hypothetical protein